MSHALRVERIGKRYRLGAKVEQYGNLRESLARAAAAPFRALRRGGRAAPDLLWAVRDVSFDVTHGEVLGIIGRNGAGKSTLLKILARVTDPTEGRADLYGRVGSLLEVGTGFHPELTGRENVYLSGAILGMRRVEIARKFDEIIAFAEVDRFVDTAVKHYSSGMYLRLAFAVAAHLEPEILIVDEVLAVGDVRFQAKCLNKMRDVSSAGRTVLFVSHSMGAIQRLCTRCLVLSDGRVVADERPDRAIETYLGFDASEAPLIEQPADPSHPARLRRVGVVAPQGQILSEVRYDEGFRIDVEYDLNEPVVGCSVWAGVQLPDQTWAFSSADTDAHPELLGSRPAGHYRTEVIIPPAWLNAGRFSVVVGIGRLGHMSLDRVELPAVTMLDTGTPEPGRHGVLQPLLPWRTESRREQPADQSVGAL